jgi:MoaA/NifB/PqqE/SkfB family radical SAM enzyme
MTLDSLSTINIELTNKCNKKCWMCGRRKLEKKGISLEEKFIDIQLIENISKQLPKNIVVQFHNNGESLLHPEFGNCVKYFDKQISH